MGGTGKDPLWSIHERNLGIHLRYVADKVLERRSSNRSESQDEQTPSPLMREGRGGGEAGHGVRGLCRPPPPIPTFPHQGGRDNTRPVF